MKNLFFRYIRLLIGIHMTTMLLIACGGTALKGIDEEIEIIPGRPIMFSMETVSRAEQVNQLRSKDFGVKAFILSNNWASAGYNAKPANTWNDVMISCNNSGICTYNPRQLWEDNKYYSFFGYYPYSDPSITVSGPENESTPYMEYRPSPNDPTLHCDVMVASTFDRTAINTGQVRLQFSHVLFSVNIAVNNYNDVTLQLDDVTCQFTSDLYSSYKINMDKSAPVPGGTMSNTSYLMANSCNVPNTSTTGSVNITDSDRFLMLIPQTGLKGKISFALVLNGQTTYKQVEFDDSETIYRAGYRYTFTLYFIGSAIHFKIIQNNEWMDNNSDIEFD